MVTLGLQLHSESDKPHYTAVQHLVLGGLSLVAMSDKKCWKE